MVVYAHMIHGMRYWTCNAMYTQLMVCYSFDVL